MTVNLRFEEALRSIDRPSALRRLAQDLLNEGRSSDNVQSEFESVRQQLRKDGRADDEDAVMDVMDFINGWCSPHMRLTTVDAANRSL